MFRPRIIPILLLKGNGLVKTTKFNSPKYIGDPINAVKLFNDLGADELAFLDIMATKEKRCVSLDFVFKVGKEANMPFSVGGGITNISQIRNILLAGAEKVILNTSSYNNPDFIKQAVNTFGSSTIVVSIDVGKTLFGKKKVFTNSGTKKTEFEPLEYARMVENLGIGEIILNTIYNDGLMQGYDIDLIKSIAKEVSVPVVACGGAGSYDDFLEAVESGYASAVAAGSLFVYHGPRKAVLINYPPKDERKIIFKRI